MKVIRKGQITRLKKGGIAISNFVVDCKGKPIRLDDLIKKLKKG